jgi:hypothetical protein
MSQGKIIGRWMPFLFFWQYREIDVWSDNPPTDKTIIEYRWRRSP